MYRIHSNLWNFGQNLHKSLSFADTKMILLRFFCLIQEFKKIPSGNICKNLQISQLEILQK